jgi:hypothetical protein
MLDLGWLLAVIAVSSLWCVTASRRLSATFDEPTYIRLGLESWHTGTSRKLLDLGTMPLPAHLDTLPLYVCERWRGQPFDLERDLARLLPIARLGTLPFWWLLLIASWVAARRIAGPWAGRLAVLLLACEPNLLAHASLATTDIPVTAALMGLLTHFAASRESRWGSRIGITAGWFALAVLTKASGLVFALLGMAAIDIGRALPAETAGPLWVHRARGLWRDGATVVAIGLGVVFLYCGSDWEVSPSFVKWTHELPAGIGKGIAVWVAEHLRIFSNAGVALMRQLRHNIQGHGVFLFDQVARRAIWYYFPVALLVKTPLPVLLLAAGAAIHPRSLANWACRVALAFLLFSLLCRVQTGIRLILPLLAIGIVGLAGATVSSLTRMRSGLHHRAFLAGAAASVIWLAISAWQVWPQGLCYTNELWGGTRAGYRCLSDSNYDWGQGLKELVHWQKQHRVPDLTVFYYGTDPTLKQLPMRRLEGDPPTPDATAVPDSLRGRTLAVSTTILFGSVRDLPWVRPWVDFLHPFEPVDRTTTFLIYRFPTTGIDDRTFAARER